MTAIGFPYGYERSPINLRAAPANLLPTGLVVPGMRIDLMGDLLITRYIATACFIFVASYPPKDFLALFLLSS
jgi:hypothetical protein